MPVAMAVASVQPVPCIGAVPIRRVRKIWTPSMSASTSVMVSPGDVSALDEHRARALARARLRPRG